MELFSALHGVCAAICSYHDLFQPFSQPSKYMDVAEPDVSGFTFYRFFR